MRATNPVFADWLLDIGNGISDPDINLLEHNIRVVHSPNALIQAVFGSILNASTLTHLTRHVILSPTNKNTDIFNEKILKMVEGRSYIRYSIDHPLVERINHPMVVPEEYLHTLQPPGMPPYRLHLKINGVYMLLRNMNVSDGLCNGTRFTLIDIDGHILTCRIIHDDKSKKDKTFLLSRITTKPPPQYPFPFNRRQYPIRPCFCMTVNKSQGSTLDMVGLDGTAPVFSHGQTYVALSSVGDFHKLKVMTPTGETTIKIIVFPQVFDKDYIDAQIRKRTVRPFCSDRLDMDDNYVHCNNPNMDEEMEQFFDQFDAEMPYDPNDGVNDQFDPDAFMFTHNDDELAYEDDWMAHDHIL
jgi:hypothetical protein